jgi:hypothetical protein
MRRVMFPSYQSSEAFGSPFSPDRDNARFVPHSSDRYGDHGNRRDPEARLASC